MTSLTYSQLDQAYQTCKTFKSKKVTVTELTDTILSLFEINLDDTNNDRQALENAAKRFLRRRMKHAGNKNYLPSDEEKAEIFIVIEENPEVENGGLEQVGNNGDGMDHDIDLDLDDSYLYRRSLLDVKKCVRYRRTEPIISYLQREAKKNKVTINELIGVVLKQINYHSDNRNSINTISESLLTSSSSEAPNVLPTAESSFLQQNMQIGRMKYGILKKVLDSKVNVKLPSWKALRSFQKEITPSILFDTQLRGVRISYEDALKFTLNSLFSKIVNLPDKVNVFLKDGVDGSGGHAIYQQLGNQQTHNIIMYMFCVLRITNSDSDMVLFEEEKKTSPFAMRPLFLVLGKEVLGNLEDIRQAVKERQQLQTFTIHALDKTVTVNLKADFTMIDAKMRSLVTGLGGAYCLLCNVSESVAYGQAHEGCLPVNVEDFFQITRTVEETKADYNRLLKEDGTLDTKTSYEDRKGVTQQPLIEDNSAFSISPLHCLMRCFDFVKILLYHLRAETFMWTQSQVKLGRMYRFLKDAEEEVKSTVLKETGLPLDAVDPTGQGGNANKGDLCKRLLLDHRDVLVSLAPSRFQDDYRELLCRTWVIIKLYTSTEKICVEAFKDFCIQTYSLILNKFNNETRWIRISPTMHALLAHSWELISNHDGRGLGEFSEGGLENNNKYLRFYRRNLARKVNQSTNLEDCITRLWLRSDPIIRSSGPSKHCSLCHKSDHFTVSCPVKTLPASTALSLDDHYLSHLIKK